MKAWRFIWIAIFMLACSSNQKGKISHRNKSTNQVSYSSSSNITKLGKTGEEEYIPILKKIKNHRFYVKIALARLGDRKFQEMMLKENRFDILEEIGRPVVPLLLGELEENSKSNKTSIIRLLGKIKDRRATIVVTKFLNSSDYKLRDAAIWALGELRDKRATVFLCRKQKANPLPIIVEALGKIKDKRAVEVLLDTLRNPLSEETMEKTLLALGKIGDRSIRAEIRKFLKHQKMKIRSAAIDVCLKLDDQEAIPILKEITRKRPSFRSYTSLKFKKATSAIEKLEEQNPERCLEIIKDYITLHTFYQRKFTQREQRLAIKAGLKSLPVLKEYLRPVYSAQIRLRAFKVLSKLGQFHLVGGGLKNLLLRKKVAQLLGYMGPKAEKYLLENIDKKDLAYFSIILRSLAQIRSPKTYPLIKEFIKANSGRSAAGKNRFMRHIIETLGILREKEAVDFLLSHLRSRFSLTAAIALLKIGDIRSFPKVIEYVKNSSKGQKNKRIIPIILNYMHLSEESFESMEKVLLEWMKEEEIRNYVYVQYMKIAFLKGQYRKAIHFYETSPYTEKIRLITNYRKWIYHYLGLCHFKDQNYGKAEKYFSLVLRDAKGFYGEWVNLGNVYFQRKNYPVAIEMADRALLLSSIYPKAYYLKGCAYLKLARQGNVRENLEEASSNFSKAIKWNPSYSKALFNLAVTKLREGDRKASLAAFQALLYNTKEQNPIYSQARSCVQ